MVRDKHHSPKNKWLRPKSLVVGRWKNRDVRDDVRPIGLIFYLQKILREKDSALHRDH